MIYSGAILTYCHGKIEVFCIRMNKLMIYFWQIYLAGIWDTQLVLAAVIPKKISAFQGRFCSARQFDIF